MIFRDTLNSLLFLTTPFGEFLLTFLFFLFRVMWQGRCDRVYDPKILSLFSSTYLSLIVALLLPACRHFQIGVSVRVQSPSKQTLPAQRPLGFCFGVKGGLRNFLNMRAVVEAPIEYFLDVQVVEFFV